MNKQYIVNLKKEERKDFLDYIKQFKLKRKTSKKELINSNFPIVIDFNENQYYLLESITCCACAAQINRIITKEQFIETIE